MEILGWSAFLVSVIFGSWFVLSMLGELLNGRYGDPHGIGVFVKSLPGRILIAALIACGLVAVVALSQRPTVPHAQTKSEQGSQGDQSFDVVIGCTLTSRTEMPTLFEQGLAHTGCYFVTLFTAVTPQCEPVPKPNAGEAERESYRACNRWVAEFWIQMAVLCSVSFAIGAGRR